MLKVATGRSQEREPWRRRANINMRLITLSIRFLVFPFRFVCLSLAGFPCTYFFANYKILNLKGWMEMEKSHDILMFFFFCIKKLFSKYQWSTHFLNSHRNLAWLGKKEKPMETGGTKEFYNRMNFALEVKDLQGSLFKLAHSIAVQ